MEGNTRCSENVETEEGVDAVGIEDELNVNPVQENNCESTVIKTKMCQKTSKKINIAGDMRPTRRSQRVRKLRRAEDFVYDEDESIQPTKLEAHATDHGERAHEVENQIYLEPATADEAMASGEREKWKTAMKEEYDSLIKNKTWSVVDTPPEIQALDTKWVFKRKLDNENRVRYKARLVVRGHRQRKGIDYNEIYSPVVRHTSLKYLFAQATKNNWLIHHMDVVTAYLQGDLEEDIYLYPPDGFELEDKN